MQRRDKKIGLFFCSATCFFVAFFIYQVALAESTNHIVISEIQIAGTKTTDDFIELYNPTNQEISLNGYRLVKRTKTGTIDTTIKSFSSSDKIPVYGFYLWANSDFTAISITPDASTSGSIAADNGVAIRYGDENTGEIIDSVAWGAASNLFVEGLVFPTNPTAGQSIERKPGDLTSDHGNSEDTNNNSNDFALRSSSEPQNNSSTIEVPEGVTWPPPNNPPIAECGSNQTVFKNTEVSFDGSASIDSDGIISGYLWDFGDSSSYQIGAKPSHSYSSTGDFTVTLKVTDDDGAENTDTCLITVIDRVFYSTKILINEFLPAPGNLIDWDSSGLADSNDEWIELINIDDTEVDLGGWVLDDISDGGSNPYLIPLNTKINPDGFLVFYKKDTGLVLNNTGDSVVLKNPDGVVVDRYDYTSTLTDKSFSRSGNSAISSWLTNFSPSPGRLNTAPGNIYPIANAGSNITNAKTGENINFNGSASSDSDGSIVSYEWNFGDGSSASGVQVTHNYSVAGSYQVTLTVRDNSNASNSTSISVSVVTNPNSNNYQNQYSDKIKIIEILPNPTGLDSEEYIKLFNFGISDLNLRNWILDDGEGGSKPFLIDYDILIKSNSPIIFSDADTKITLNNNGDSVRLFDPDKKLIDSVVYTGSAKEGVPYVLENGSWKWKTSNQENIETKKQQESEVIEQEGDAIKPTPDIPKLLIQEPLNILSDFEKPESKGEDLLNSETQNIIRIDSVGSGIKLASSVTEVKSVNNTDLKLNNISVPVKSTIPTYQKPIVVIPVTLLTLFFTSKFIFLPKDFKVISEKILNYGNREDDLSDLFK